MESGQSAVRSSKWTQASLLMVLGLLAYVAGTAMYACRFFFRFAFRDVEEYHLYEWSIVAKDVGVILVILGLVLYVIRKRKGV